MMTPWRVCVCRQIDWESKQTRVEKERKKDDRQKHVLKIYTITSDKRRKRGVYYSEFRIQSQRFESCKLIASLLCPGTAGSCLTRSDAGIGSCVVT
ncbi:hypothetical protein M441DRAFT_340513 [Trichoderma asperellum CBS 433.97]|uniref:Uncharacterized protein n=1 Tax=Trichoderma asperellum (strain ATCC 204424 / CBS 433.97 / NBRC 101777) TaxID=1042311 RepID=A0A2T3ZGY7_TRIA4|nr:hypothetical protein M441DRAFT_340513 [Trichoderma asperellum CBS 433.97]PTB44053.1 hypothetical protein M441DRAFT_340513 [Trichoderma asperellum CBS 433.97]